MRLFVGDVGTVPATQKPTEIRLLPNPVDCAIPAATAALASYHMCEYHGLCLVGTSARNLSTFTYLPKWPRQLSVGRLPAVQKAAGDCNSHRRPQAGSGHVCAMMCCVVSVVCSGTSSCLATPSAASSQPRGVAGLAGSSTESRLLCMLVCLGLYDALKAPG